MISEQEQKILQKEITIKHETIYYEIIKIIKQEFEIKETNISNTYLGDTNIKIYVEQKDKIIPITITVSTAFYEQTILLNMLINLKDNLRTIKKLLNKLEKINPTIQPEFHINDNITLEIYNYELQEKELKKLLELKKQYKITLKIDSYI